MEETKLTLEKLEEKIDLAWNDYICFLEERGLPSPEGKDCAKRLFRGGFIYCLAYLLPDDER